MKTHLQDPQYMQKQLYRPKQRRFWYLGCLLLDLLMLLVIVASAVVVLIVGIL